MKGNNNQETHERKAIPRVSPTQQFHMLLTCDRGEQISRVAGENIWAIQISGKSAGESRSVFRKVVRPPKGGRQRLKVAEEPSLPMYFRSEGRTETMRAVPKEKVLRDEQMFDFGASHNEMDYGSVCP